jgi:hypothetical protein
MEWFEYIIIAVAVILVILPFILSYRNKKKGKSACACEYCSKTQCASCPVKKIEKEFKSKKGCCG